MRSTVKTSNVCLICDISTSNCYDITAEACCVIYKVLILNECCRFAGEIKELIPLHMT